MVIFAPESEQEASWLERIDMSWEILQRTEI